MSRIGLQIPNFTFDVPDGQLFEKEILGQIEELQDVGVEYFIFNMPLSAPDQVRRAGELLNGV